jgi:tetratricopeptide (TPR) repeat protein
MRPVLLVAAALGALAVSAQHAAAQRIDSEPKPHTQVTVVVAAKPVSERQAADEAVVKAAGASVKAGGLLALREQLPALRKVLDGAPKKFPRVEQRGGEMIVRGETPDEAMVLTVMASVTGAGASKSGSFTTRQEYDTYPEAALLLASYANETKQPAEAIRWLDRGLALQPDNAFLTAEKASALEFLHRPADALGLLDGWLKTNAMASNPLKALILRDRGFALVELQRLDEAEAAYRDSLKAEPTHLGAQHELTYIAGLKAGGAKGKTVSVTADKAARGEIPAGEPKR